MLPAPLGNRIVLDNLTARAALEVTDQVALQQGRPFLRKMFLQPLKSYARKREVKAISRNPAKALRKSPALKKNSANINLRKKQKSERSMPATDKAFATI